MDIKTKLDELKRQQNAIILAHNYQVPDVQDIADFVGDSLGLSMRALDTDTNVIVFCGVDFMAESAKVLNPNKLVLHPEPDAKCPMAAMIDADGLRQLKAQYPDASVVTYVNCSAEVKAESDICCTSANAVKVVRSVKGEVIFVPDENLGLYVKRTVKDKNVLLWPGYCSSHRDIKKEDILRLKREHPRAETLVHPECTPDVIDIADHVFSTTGMIGHIRSSQRSEFIIGTECGIIHRMKKVAGDKSYYPVPGAVCPNMKRITLEKVVRSLETLQPTVELSPELIERARMPLDRMIEIGRED